MRDFLDEIEKRRGWKLARSMEKLGKDEDNERSMNRMQTKEGRQVNKVDG